MSYVTISRDEKPARWIDALALILACLLIALGLALAST
jgi:hypothetical protein